MSLVDVPEPDQKQGIEYWKTQPASYDGVLGGFGAGSLPRIDALGSRQFILYLIPSLSTVPSAIRPLVPPPETRTRALDVGAGVGRVTFDVLLPLVSDVVLMDPVEKFVQEAWSRALVGTGNHTQTDPPSVAEMAKWKGLHDGSKSVTFLQDALQSFDPAHPLKPSSTKVLGRLGYHPPSNEADTDTGFDIIWCQWCLGHVNDADLLAFFRRSRAALRKREDKGGFIIVKENLCRNTDDEGPRMSFDDTDSTITRSDMMWKKLFSEAGLELVREQLQCGLPKILYEVKMYALR